MIEEPKITQIRSALGRIGRIASHLSALGMDRAAETLWDNLDLVEKLSDQLDKELSNETFSRYKDSQQASINVFRAAIAGTALAISQTGDEDDKKTALDLMKLVEVAHESS